MDNQTILSNPGLGSKETPIPSDCDLVIDDTLIDIKCTKQNHIPYELLQLLGYSSLLKFNNKYNLCVNNICILNLLEGKLRIYNIENISDDNLFEYLQLLTNNYDPEKEITSRKIDQEINYPLFVDNLKEIKSINYPKPKSRFFRKIKRRKLEKMTANELKDIIRDENDIGYKILLGGRKSELIDRIMEHKNMYN